MQNHSKPSLTDTIRFLKVRPSTVSQDLARLHLENLLYMTSILYVDDKKNEKHLKRVNEIITAMEEHFAQEMKKEGGGEGHYEGDVYLVSRLLVINKLLDLGISQVKKMIEAPVSKAPETTRTQAAEPQAQQVVTTAGTEQPKLRETLSFLLSFIDNPALAEKNIPIHLLNIEKISHIIRIRQQDPKLLKVKESILAVLAKIYGTYNADQLRLQLNNTLKIFKNMAQYKKLMVEFEASLKSYILPADAKPVTADTNEAARRLQCQKQDEEFYQVFKDEKNMLKRVAMIEKVLKDASYRYNKELTAACMRVEGGLRLMGLS